MAKLKFMEEPAMDASLMICPHCGERDRIGIHQETERRYRCHKCKKTFAETQGTVFAGIHYPRWVVVLVLTLLAYGCPVTAIVAGLMLDERTVLDWLGKAGRQGKRVQESLVTAGQVTVSQVQADEVRVKTQGGVVWMASAMDVFSRLWLWGEVSPRRDKHLVRRVFDKVAAAVSCVTQPILIAVDGFAAYPNAIRAALHTKRYTGKRGRPKHIPWPNVQIVQVVKHVRGRQLKTIERRLVQGTWQQVHNLIACSQTAPGQINTAYIERLNATFRARMPSLGRRTRHLALTVRRLEDEMFWIGAVYNFCSTHSSLQATPAMAADLTDHVWSVRELLSRGGPLKALHAIL
jgi:transposase-like protein